MAQSLKVFVYGTLKPEEVNYPVYCQGKVIKAIPAYTWGEIYHLRRLGYPAMTEGNSKVQGYLLTFADQGVLEDLDRLETYDPQRPPTENQYNRVLLDVYETLTQEFLTQAWGYVMSLPQIQFYGGELISSGCWSRNYIL